MSRKRGKRMVNRPKPLNARQREAVRLWLVGPDGVRGNKTQAYIAAGYQARGNSAETAAARMFRNVQVLEAIAEFHEPKDAETKTKLRDWKAEAVPAQERLVAISRGEIPGAWYKPKRRRGRVLGVPQVDELGEDGEPEDQPARIADRDDAAAAKVILDANLEIIERAYPKKLQIGVEDPAGVLAGLLGVKPESVPPEDDE